MTLTVPTLTDDQVAKLRKTTELILGDVDSYDQTVWGRNRERNALHVAPSAVAQYVSEHNQPLTMPSTIPLTCGTAFCFAGHYVVNVAGYAPLWSRTDVDVHNFNYTVSGLLSCEYQGGETSVPAVASIELGLTEEWADLLFSQRNSLRRVIELVYLLTHGEVDLLDAYHELVEQRHDVRDRDLEFELDAARCVQGQLRFVAHGELVAFVSDAGPAIADRVHA